MSMIEWITQSFYYEYILANVSNIIGVGNTIPWVTTLINSLDCKYNSDYVHEPIMGVN